LKAASRRSSAREHEWEYVPEGWTRQRADPAIRGWDVESTVDAYTTKLPAFEKAIQGPGPIAIPTSALFPVGSDSIWEQNVLLAYAYALALASRDTSRVSVLDWGGGLGFFYLLSRALLPAEVDIEYHCKEVAGLCEAGRELVPAVHFHDDESCLDRRYDLVLASSSVQYSESWSELVGRLAGSSARYLYLTRVPVALASSSFVVRQRAYSYGLETEFLSWVFNHGEFVDAVTRSGMELVREFLIGPGVTIQGAPENEELRGFLFRRG
jgi:putative methyltransferase (TIGR04325 family)